MFNQILSTIILLTLFKNISLNFLPVMDAELFKPFKTMFMVLRVLGMWQDGNQTWTYFIVGYLYHFILIGIYFVYAVVFTIFAAESLEDFVDLFGMAATYAAMMFKWINFFYKLKSIKKSLETLTSLMEFSADERWKTREHVKSQVAFGFKVYKAFWFTAWTSCISAAFVPFFTHKLPYRFWFPFDTENSEIGFWFAAFFLVFNSFVTSSVDIAVDILPVVFMTFAIGLTNELSKKLSDIGKIEKDYKNCKSLNYKECSELIKCIEIHLKIKEFVAEIHSNFSTVILLQGLMSSLILCTCAFTMSTVGKK